MYPRTEILESPESLVEMAKMEGEQTKVTETVRAIADEIGPEGSLKGLEIVKATCSYIRTLVPTREELHGFYLNHTDKEFDKRARTADELLDKSNLLPNRMRARNISGCIEIGHVARSLLLAKGIPCVYTETLQKEWAEAEGLGFDPHNQNAQPMLGHVFIDVYIQEDDSWYTVDPGSGVVLPYSDYTKDGKEYIYPTSAKDSWDLGFTNNTDFQVAVVNFLSSLSTEKEP